MSEAPDQRRKDRRQKDLLALLVPPLVHRLNNLLAITGGQCDLWSMRPIGGDATFRAELERVRMGTLEAGRALCALSELSKPTGSELEREAELGPALDAVRALATPLANESGVALRVERIGGDATVFLGPRRLERALQLAAIGAVLGVRDDNRLGEGRGDGRIAARVRLRAIVERETVAFALTAAPGLAADARAAIGADLAELAPSGALRARSGRGADGWRVVAPARSVPAEPGSGHARRHARVLLVEADELTADLIATVLREEGYRVEIAPDLERGHACARASDVLLLDRTLAARSPERAAHVIGLVCCTLLLGDPLPGLAPALPKPCGPNELLRAVAELTARR